MILTVTLNAAIDRTVAVPSFRLGQRHRAVESRTVAGGKGINVARALKRIGRPVVATGLAGGPTGNRILERLDEDAILSDFTRIAGESRINLSVVDPTTGEQTEINERGPAVSPEEIDRFVEKLLYLAQGASVCVLAGSMPPGGSQDLYARLVTGLRELGVITVLDTDGEPMRAGLRAGPAIVVPNTLEAEEAVGHEFGDAADIALGLSELLEMGAGEAIITSAWGCTAALRDDEGSRRFQVSVDRLEPVSTVGSGDCFLAGYVAGRYDGMSPGDCLTYAVACGAESTQHFGAGTLDPAEVDRMAQRVELRELDIPAGVR